MQWRTKKRRNPIDSIDNVAMGKCKTLKEQDGIKALKKMQSCAMTRTATQISGPSIDI